MDPAPATSSMHSRLSIFAETGTTAAVSDMLGPCWNFDKVYASNLPVFNSDTSGSSFTLQFTGDLWFNMASTALRGGVKQTIEDAQTREFYKKDDVSNEFKYTAGIWMTENKIKVEGQTLEDGPALTSSTQGNGTAAFYKFIKYTPKAGEYPSCSLCPVILIEVYQQVTPVRDTHFIGYLYMKLEASMFKSTIVPTMQEVISKQAHFGIVGLENTTDHTSRVLIAYNSTDCTGGPQLMALYANFDGVGLNYSTLYCCKGDYFFKGLFQPDPVNWTAKSLVGDDEGSNDSSGKYLPFQPLSELMYSTSTMMVSSANYAAFMAYTNENMTFDDNSDYTTQWKKYVQLLPMWELVIPVNKAGDKDAWGSSMGDANQQTAMETFLNSRCMTLDTEAGSDVGKVCKTGFKTCTKFLSKSPTGLACQAAALLNVGSTKAVYRAICGVDAAGNSLNTPVAKEHVAALATPDCACINYPQSTYKQASMMGMDYKEFSDWRNENRIPNLLPEGRCWWPSCTNPANTLRFPDDPVPGSPAATAVTPQAGQAACGTVINCIAAMRGISVDHDSIANATIVQNCGGVANTDTPPGAEGMNGGTDDYHTPASAPGPAGVMDQVKLWPKQSWFIPVVVVLGILILAAIGWFVYQNYFSKTTTAATPLKPKPPVLGPIGKT